MTFLAQLAFRNLFRNFRRTLITSVAVVFGVALQIVGWGLVDGLDENVLRAARDSTTGDILLRPDGYPTDGLDYPLAEAQVVPGPLADRLDEKGNWTARTYFPARIVHGSESTRANGIAYDAAKEDTVFPRDKWKVDGRWPVLGANELALGRGLARLLDVKVGDEVVVTARTFPGALNALSYTVVGVIKTDNAGLDNLTVWVEMLQAESLLQLEGRRTHLALVLDRGTPEAAKPALAGLGFTANTIREESADILAINTIRRRALGLLVFIIMAIAGTGIANTVIMAAYERIREVGTLMALGMKKSQVAAMFLLEGAAMGTAAGLFGAAIGSFAVQYWQRNGINLAEKVLEQAGDIPMSAVLYTHFSWPPVFVALGFGLFVSVGASIWPARYAANLNPADAVKAD